MIQKLKLLFSFVSFVFFISNLQANDFNQTAQIKSKVIYAKYKSYPKIVYTKQRFKVVIQANILLPKYKLFTFYTDIKDGTNIEKLTNDIIWYKKSDTIYETTLEYKATNKKFILPTTKVLSVIPNVINWKSWPFI